MLPITRVGGITKTKMGAPAGKASKDILCLLTWSNNELSGGDSDVELWTCHL